MYPVVLVHGVRTSSTMWQPQLERLRQRGWEGIAPDLPGHGSRRDEPFTLESAISTIHDCLEQAGAAHLAGISLGGMLAIHAAATTNSPLVSLVAASCAVQPTLRSARAYAAGIRLADRFGDAGVRRVMGEEAADAFLRGGRASLETVQQALSSVATIDLRNDLAQISAPTTILSPRWDQLRLHERSFAKAARRGRLVVLSYGNHMANLSHPDRYTGDLERLLREAETLEAS